MCEKPRQEPKDEDFYRIEGDHTKIERKQRNRRKYDGKKDEEKDWRGESIHRDA